MKKDFLYILAAVYESGALEPDPVQQWAAGRLQDLYERLKEYPPGPWRDFLSPAQKSWRLILVSTALYLQS